MPQVPVADITKNVRFQKSYTSLTLNQKMDGLVRMNGVLEGLQVTEVSPSLLETSIGAFIQTGIIVEVEATFNFPMPETALPWTAYGYTDDEMASSPVTIAATSSEDVPAGAVVLATTEDGVTWIQSRQISIEALRADITALERQFASNILVNAGFELLNQYKGTTHVMLGPCLDGWNAEHLSEKGAGSYLELVTDSDQTLRGGVSARLLGVLRGGGRPPPGRQHARGRGLFDGPDLPAHRGVR